MDYKEVRSEIKGGRVDAVLKEVGRAQGIQFLLEALNDKDKRIRVNSIRHLEEMEVVEAVGSLAPLLSDRDQDVQNAAVSALSKIGKQSVISIIWSLETPGSQRENASRVLSNIGPKFISENLEEIKKKDIGSSFHLATFLELYHPDSEIKQRGIDVSSALLSAGMSEFSLKDTANKIFSSLEDPVPEVRERGAQMIGRMAAQPELSILKLTKLLDDASEPVVIAAINSLAMFGEPRVLPNLEKKAKSKSPEIRKAVAANLGKIFSPKAAELLIPLLIDEKEASIVGTADFSLQRLGENAIPALIASFSMGNPRSVDVIFKIGRASIPPLLSVLNSNDENSVKQAQDALIQFSEKSIDPLSQEISRQPSPQLLRNSIPILGQLPGNKPIMILWSLSKDKSNRKLIAANLKESVQAVECLVQNIEELDERAIEGISAILMQLPVEMAVEPLILGFSTAPTKYHNFLINLLQNLGEKAILSRFKDMAKSSPEEAKALLLALCGIEEFQNICKKGRKSLKIR